MADHHPDAEAARARLAQASADVGQAGVLPNPEFDFAVGDLPLGKTNPPDLSLSQTMSFTFGLQTPIELGKRGPRVESARLRHLAAGEDYAALLTDHIKDARAALTRVAYLKLRQAVLEQNLEGARQILTLEKTRVDRGDMPEVDYQRLALDTQSLEIDVMHNDSDLRAAMAACRSALAAPCSDEGVTDALLASVAPLPAPLPSAESGIQSRPDVQAVRLRRSSAEEDAVLAGRKAIPDPTIGVAYTKDLLTIAGNQPNTFGVSASIPLPVFEHGQHEAAQAKARASEGAAQERALVEQSTGDVQSLLSHKEWLERSLSSVEKEGLPRSEQIRLATRKAFNLGDVNLTDLLLAERTHRGLLVQVLDMKFDLAVTRIGLLAALGIDTDLIRKTINDGGAR